MLNRTSLDRLAMAEAWADRQAALSITATLAIPVAAFTLIFAPLMQGIGLVQAGLTAVIDVFGWLWFALSLGFIYSVAGSAFGATTARRRARYELLATIGARGPHFRRLLTVELGLPALVGIGAGFVLGWSLIFPFSASGLIPGWDPNRLGLATFIGPVFLVAPPALAGVAWAARASASQVGRPRNTTTTIDPIRRVSAMGKVGMALLGVSGPSMLLSVLAFHQWEISVESPLPVLGIVVSVIGLVAGVVLLTPALAWWLAHRAEVGGTGGLAARLLTARPDQLVRTVGATLVLVVLVVMASAGIKSDAGQRDNSGDRRQLVLFRTSDQIQSDLQAVADRHGNAVLGMAAIEPAAMLYHRSDLVPNRGHQLLNSAVLSEELIEVLDLSPDDVAFVEAGGVLLDSDAIDAVVTHQPPFSDINQHDHFEVETRHIRRGGGLTQPGPTVYTAGPAGPAEPGPTAQLVRFERPISSDMVNDIFEQDPLRRNASLPSDRGDEDLTVILAGMGALLTFALALSTSNLAAGDQDEDFQVQVSLGAPPNVRPRLLATQTAWQLLLSVGLGVPLGVMLFWLVTRGDTSVPDPVVPGLAIGSLTAAAVLAVAVVRLMHGPATPAVSSRVSSLIEV